MCGISGYWGGFSPKTLELSSQLIAHRGPDASGTWFDLEAGVGLAHRRLSILDLSPAGAQPMVGAGGSVILVYNGEIYNFRELKSELEKVGYSFIGNSDTEVLLALYLRDGIEMLSKLNGIFAFAIYDKRNSSLFLARDALGVKPLYISVLSEGVAFSSEIKGFLPFLGDDRDLDVHSIHRYLTFQWCPGNGTPLKAIRKVTPGSAILIKNGAVTKQWDWYQHAYHRGGVCKSEKGNLIDLTVVKMREAVQRQLVADVPVGAFLSGGVDSSAIVAFAREQVPDILCFTIETAGGRDVGVSDDLPYAKKVARHLDVKLDVVKVESEQMIRDMGQMMSMLDEPLADPAAFNVYYICQLARKNGIKVMLSGSGGDDIFTGYWRHQALQYEQLWAWLPKSLREMFAQGVGRIDQRTTIGRRLNRLFAQAGEAPSRRMVGYFAWTQEKSLRKLYSKDFLTALGETHADQVMLDYLEQSSESNTKLDNILMLEQRFYLADHNLLYTDKMSMAAGVEARVPFLDLELVAHASAIPDNYRIRSGNAKWILKKAMEAYLPREVIYRPKTGFGVPLRKWILHDLKEMVDDILSAERIRKRGIFDENSVRQLIQRNKDGKVDGAYTIFSLLCMEMWLDKFLRT